MEKTILILTSDAGFGHRKAAEAIQSAIWERGGGTVNPLLINPFEGADVPDLVKSVEDSYDTMVTQVRHLYRFTYHATNTPAAARLMQEMAALALNKSLVTLIKAHQPRAIITTYPVFTRAIVRELRDLGHQAKVAVAVTDFVSIHRLWFYKRVDMTFVPSEYVLQKAHAAEISPDRIMLTGLPVNPAIVRETRSKAEIRRDLGWDIELPTVLIVGSARNRQAPVIARLLDQAGLKLQVVAVSGGADDVEHELKSTRWRGVAHTYGMVDNLPTMMKAADLIITKAGGMIVSEALAAGLPLILHEALPGQETGNVKYVVENGAGIWAPGAISVLATVVRWLVRETAEFEACRAAAQRIGRPNAAFDIADWLLAACN